jgi:hypothetical protein
MDSDGLIKVASADEARFDHRYVNGQLESLGLLVEESRQNLLLNSVVTTSNWSVNSSTVTNSATSAPDGTNTAARVQVDTANGYVAILNNSVTPGQSYTFSFWVKSYSGSSGTWGVNWFENVTGHNRTTVNITRNWQRFSITFTPTQSSVNVYISDNRSSLANINDGYVWGAQLEAGSFMTSLIPTSGDTATRTADNVSMTGDNFSEWYNPTEGTFYVSSSFYADGNAAQLIFQIDNNNNANRNGITFRNELSGNQIRPYDVNFSASPAGFDLWTHTGSLINTNYKTAFALKSNDMAAVTNYPEGSLGLSSSTSRILQEKTTLRLGSGISNVSPLNGHISKLSYYPRRLSNSQLQNLTK